MFGSISFYLGLETMAVEVDPGKFDVLVAIIVGLETLGTEFAAEAI